jgi:acyl carrier protein
MTTAAEVKAMIVSLLQPALAASGRTVLAFTDQTDLRAEGLIDSLGFVELLAGLEQQLGGPVDIADLDPERLTNLGALSQHIAARHIASQVAKP